MTETKRRGRPPKAATGGGESIGDLMLEYHGLEAADPGARAPKRRPRYISFRQQYRGDPVAFTHDCFDWKAGQGPAFYQDEILDLLPRAKRLAVRGPHGLGKTAMMAWLTWWWSLTRDGLDWKCPSTASSWNQLIKYLWPEIHKWAKKARWDVVGRGKPDAVNELQRLALRLGTGEAFAVTSDQPELIEGCHADHLLFLYDESKSIPERTFDALEGAFSTPGEILVGAFSTPGDPSGRFYDIHDGKPGFEDWTAFHVTLEMAVRAGRVDPLWAERRAAQWGRQSAMYKNRVEGEFANSSEDGVIPLAWILAAEKRYADLVEKEGEAGLGEFVCHFMDVAGEGEDECARAERYERGIRHVEFESHRSTMVTVGRIKQALERTGGFCGVDTIGIGAGVYARAEELELDVESFKSSRSAKGLTDASGELTFLNLRAASWWQLRERLNPETGDGTVLPPIKKLREQLAMPRWTTASNGSIVIESKKDIRKRAGGSPDGADAVVGAMFSDGQREIQFH